MNKVALLGMLLVAALALAGCVGLGCGTGPGQSEVSLYVSDAKTGAAVADVSFYDADYPISATCREPDVKNPKLCAYYILALYPGTMKISVKAPGYQSTDLSVDVQK